MAGSVTVPAGAPLEDIELLGSGGSPSIVLTSPSGRQVIPSNTDVHASAYAVPFPAAARTVVVLNHPQPGTWTLAPGAGSAPIRQARAASGLTAPGSTPSCAEPATGACCATRCAALAQA